jgi:hypothetical protein
MTLSAAQKPDLPWHQCYEPVEDREVLDYVSSCLTEAQQLFGPPAIPVREIHIRYTRLRKDRYGVTRAALIAPSQLSKQVLSSPTPAHRRFQELLPPSALAVLKRARAMPLSLEDQLHLTQSLNTLIDDPALGKDPLLRPLGRAASSGFRLSFSRSSHRKTNRRILEALFPRSILPAKKPPLVATKFNLCECIDRTRGAFALYIASKPGSDQFYLELAHETAHLLNADLFDWYVEGANNVFAERMAAKTGRSWEPWQKLFHRGRKKEPYALAYAMMKEVMTAAGAEGMKTLLSCAEPRTDGPHQRINISAWLATLPLQDAGRVDAAISRYAHPL